MQAFATRLHWLLPLLLTALAACGGGGSEPATSAPPPAATPADVSVLMIGNSHTAGAELPARLQRALQASLPGRSVLVMAAPRSAFLDEHLGDAGTLALLASRRWQAVVLQAQKVSSSGLYLYSTAEAEEWVRRVRAQGGVPVLYPEWPRRGVDEAARIWDVYAGIAVRAVACMPPIPQAWALALAADPTLPLYDADGNHAAAAGAQLTALVLSSTLTGASAATLPDLPQGGEPALQQRLRAAAAAAAAQQPPRAFCPGEALLR
jgi:hypothetical protein